MHTFSFSDATIHVQAGDHLTAVSVHKPTIILNASKKPVTIGEQQLAPLTSSVFQQVNIQSSEQLILIEMPDDFSALKPFSGKENIMKKWKHVHDIFPLPHLKNTKLWRSEKEQIGKVAYNLWFAAEGTDCGIHNEHDFLEIHTQIWGTGHMQKFHEKNADTMYQDIYMTPGYTHEPFCCADHKYPWHRYFADTDCIWLAVEYYD